MYNSYNKPYGYDRPANAYSNAVHEYEDEYETPAQEGEPEQDIPPFAFQIGFDADNPPVDLRYYAAHLTSSLEDSIKDSPVPLRMYPARAVAHRVLDKMTDLLPYIADTALAKVAMAYNVPDNEHHSIERSALRDNDLHIDTIPVGVATRAPQFDEAYIRSCSQQVVNGICDAIGVERVTSGPLADTVAARFMDALEEDLMAMFKSVAEWAAQEFVITPSKAGHTEYIDDDLAPDAQDIIGRYFEDDAPAKQEENDYDER